jgi:hypothetical protein
MIKTVARIRPSTGRFAFRAKLVTTVPIEPAADWLSF